MISSPQSFASLRDRTCPNLNALSLSKWSDDGTHGWCDRSAGSVMNKNDWRCGRSSLRLLRKLWHYIVCKCKQVCSLPLVEPRQSNKGRAKSKSLLNQIDILNNSKCLLSSQFASLFVRKLGNTIFGLSVCALAFSAPCLRNFPAIVRLGGNSKNTACPTRGLGPSHQAPHQIPSAHTDGIDVAFFSPRAFSARYIFAKPYLRGPPAAHKKSTPTGVLYVRFSR